MYLLAGTFFKLEKVLIFTTDFFLLDQKFSGFDLLCIAVRSDSSKFLTLDYAHPCKFLIGSLLFFAFQIPFLLFPFFGFEDFLFCYYLRATEMALRNYTEFNHISDPFRPLIVYIPPYDDRIADWFLMCISKSSIACFNFAKNPCFVT
jgi:hypothetical protein